jgi:GNAT superfamily N-acetyltransferase
MALELPTMACWSLAPDDALGVRLLARGFEWGWQPHWMALDLARLPADDAVHEVVVRDVHLTVVEQERTVGHVAVYPWRGAAGIYDMWVVPERRRHGIGRALTLAACRLGRERGCSHALLNATREGELLYRTVGFESQGWGQTWWMHRGRRPSARQTELVEAIGFGDLDRLAALRPTRTELEREIPGPGVPLAVAVVTGQAGAAGWILRRRPDLASTPIEPRGGTLLHTAVEHDDAALVEVALEHGADLRARDRMWRATPLDWAEHLGRHELAERLRR